MSGSWDTVADQIMASLTSRTGVAKGAAMRAELPLTEAVVRQLCTMFGEFADQVKEHTEHTITVLKAISAPTPEQQYAGLAPYRPDQWKVGLIPNVPPRHGNGHSYLEEPQ